MAYDGANVESLPRKELETEDTDDMRSHGNLTVEVDCPSVGSSECPSMASGFSPTDSMASPGWHEGGQFPAHAYERHAGTTSLRSAFRFPEMAPADISGLPTGSFESQERMPMADYLSAYDEGVEPFWIPSDIPKPSYESHHGLPYQAPMSQYPQMARNPYRHPQAAYLPESATNPCLSRSIFNQPERLPSSVSMSNMIPWMPPAEAIPQTIQPSQAYQAPVTPPPSYSDFPASLNFKTQTPTTSIRSGSFGTPSGTETPMSRASGGAGDYQDDYQSMSPVFRDGYAMPQRHQSRKLSRKPSRNNMALENLPLVIKQVQFKCKEPGCKGRFKRQEHLKRHMKSHSKEKPHVCWVPGCHRAFSRSDNLNAHYTKTHSKRGGRNRYVATLDETSPDYNPDFRGQLTADGRPMYGTKLEEPMEDDDARELSVEWE